MTEFLTSGVPHSPTNDSLQADSRPTWHLNISQVEIVKQIRSNLKSLYNRFLDPFSEQYIFEEYNQRDAYEKRLAVATVMQKNAASYEEWSRASRELDFLLGNEKWKEDPVSNEYDYQLVAERTKELRVVRESGNYLRLLFLLRTSLTRNIGDIGNTSVQQCLVTVLNAQIRTGDDNSEAEYVDDYSKLDELLRTRHAFGRTALLLSGGGTMGMLHSGVVEALIECNLLPKIISGSSAGAIVASALCTRTDNEIPELLENFTYFNLDVFEETGHEESPWTKVARFLKHGAWTDISYLEISMKELFGELTFQEAYNRTRRVLNIPVSSASVLEPPRLLNYLTAPNVYIWSAVCASCSVPFVFSSHDLFAKDPYSGQPVPWNPSPQHWIDGSVDNDLPMSRLNEMFNVNHFIVSQVNPHVVPFLKSTLPKPYFNNSGLISVCPFFLKSWLEKKNIATDLVANAVSISAKITDRALRLAISETMHRLLMSSELGIMPNVCTKLRSVLSQTYSGDVTILPEVFISEIPLIMKNPTSKFLLDTKRRGRVSTWPKVSVIRNHCAVELALDACILELRSRAVFRAMVKSSQRLSVSSENNDRRHIESGSVDLSTNLNHSLGSSSLSMANSKFMNPQEGESAEPFKVENAIEEDYNEEDAYETEETDNDDNNAVNESTSDFVMGILPDDTDFDIGTSLTVGNSAAASPSISPLHTRTKVSRRSSMSHPVIETPPISPYHNRRLSGGSDGYFYNHFNYSHRPGSSTNLSMGESLAGTPGIHSAKVRPTLYHQHAYSSYIRPESTQASPRRKRTASEIPVPVGMTSSAQINNPNVLKISTIFLPPSIESETGEDNTEEDTDFEELSAPMREQRVRMSGHYWPLRYGASSSARSRATKSSSQLLHHHNSNSLTLSPRLRRSRSNVVVHGESTLHNTHQVAFASEPPSASLSPTLQQTATSAAASVIDLITATGQPYQHARRCTYVVDVL
ncbi:acyl transferase/acyl hydrolase/lysophospholipase [Lipomyces japonicus]|uniref:acyl transferase/acyl hydrolase/lysophospholipase n=1 Tax=Lipomyces japonicus TaxID=56871 RepID=UPI0034CE579C